MSVLLDRIYHKCRCALKCGFLSLCFEFICSLISFNKSSSSPRNQTIKENSFKQDVLLNVENSFSFSWLSSNGQWNTLAPQPICGSKCEKNKQEWAFYDLVWTTSLPAGEISLPDKATRFVCQKINHLDVHPGGCCFWRLPLFVHLRVGVEIVIPELWLGRHQFKGVLFAACCERLYSVSLQAHHAYL